MTQEVLPQDVPVQPQSVADDFARPFVPAPELLTQEGPQGIRFDFNEGVRVSLPEGKWRVTLRDEETSNILFLQEVVGPCIVASSRKYFVRLSLEVQDPSSNETVFKHVLDLKKKQVLIQLPLGTLGDSIAWFSYVDRFREKHGCELVCMMSELISPLFKDSYKKIKFVTKAEAAEYRPYATYRVGLFFAGDTENHQPSDFRVVGLHKTAAYILGVDTNEMPPKILPQGDRPIPEKYVCIAAQSSSQAKYWNNPHGWRAVIDFLKAEGYRVLCIDKEPVHGTGIVWNHLPHGAEDFTGAKPLTERARFLQHADFFVGLSSGLSWLAWACETPAVLISGMTHPVNEYFTPYRVWNTHVCNSCWNDTRITFNHFDFLWCPRQANTPQQFQCTSSISAEYVIATIKRLIADNKG